VVKDAIPQPYVKYCPICKKKLRSIPRKEMSIQDHQIDLDPMSSHTHIYECTFCDNRFEINQKR